MMDRVVEWPTVEEAKDRIEVHLADGKSTTLQAVDLLVVMRELGRVTADNRALREALLEALGVLGQFITEENGVMMRVRAALAAEPASGELTEGERLCEEARQAVARGEQSPIVALSSPPPPTQGEEETARSLMSQFDIDFRGQFFHERSDARRDFRDAIAAALRQRADEATRAEREACAQEADNIAKTWENVFEAGAAAVAARNTASGAGQAAAAIRARIKP